MRDPNYVHDSTWLLMAQEAKRREQNGPGGDAAGSNTNLSSSNQTHQSGNGTDPRSLQSNALTLATIEEHNRRLQRAALAQQTNRQRSEQFPAGPPLSSQSHEGFWTTAANDNNADIIQQYQQMLLQEQQRRNRELGKGS